VGSCGAYRGDAWGGGYGSTMKTADFPTEPIIKQAGRLRAAQGR
jgi:hypothetical protein